MKNDELKILCEIQEMLELIVDRQDGIMKRLDQLREEQKRLEEEVRNNTFVLNYLPLRNEIIN